MIKEDTVGYKRDMEMIETKLDRLDIAIRKWIFVIELMCASQALVCLVVMVLSVTVTKSVVR